MANQLVRRKLNLLIMRTKFMSSKKGKNHEYTSKSVASKASKILRSPTASKAQKSVAASALTQAKNKKK